MASLQALDGYTARHGGQRLLLTVASPAGSQNYSKMHLGAMAQVLDFFNLMAYDYAGSWDRTTGHQSNWYPSQNHPAATPFSTDAAVRDHIAAGVPAHQIVIGMPLYGRAFESTEGLGEAFSGVGEGSWENGVWDYKALPRPGAVEKTDEAAVASYCYNPQSRTMVTYDTVQIAEEKMRYIKQQGLGGAMFWELSGDRRDDHSLVAAVCEQTAWVSPSQADHMRRHIGRSVRVETWIKAKTHCTIPTRNTTISKMGCRRAKSHRERLVSAEKQSPRRHKKQMAA